MSFNEREYTVDSIKKQLILIELHSKDGSAAEAGCDCIQGKHLRALEGFAEEGAGFALTDAEKQLYSDLGAWSRQMRKNLEQEKWRLPTTTNKKTRHLRACLAAAEIKCCGVHTKDYSGCKCNPLDLCRA